MLRRTANLAVLFVIASLLCAPRCALAQQAPLRGLDEYITRTMRDWEIPGLAIAVVKDDAIVLAKGYGVRKLGDRTPVDERTLFAIASNSKAFTTAALALLVDEGKLGWDDPVIKHLPGFQMYDPYVTRELTVRDLLCHRGGLERHDLLWMANPDFSRDQVMRRLRHVKPSWSFRSKYGYQNLMFLVAGQIIPAVTGKSWDDFVKERLFTPLGMSASSTSTRALAGKDNVATPHQRIAGKVEPIAWLNVDNMGPAGSINSNVHEVAQWLRLQLGEGVYQKKPLLSAAVMREMHSPQMIVPREGVLAKLLPQSHFVAYGLGWMMIDHRGKKVIQHGGSLPGMNSQTFLVPEEKLGIVVLTNFRFNAVPMALPYRILDAYLGAPPRDYTGEALAIWKDMEQKREAAEKKEAQERMQGTKPSLPLEKYAGTYTDELWGAVRVAVEKGGLVVRYGTTFIGTLEHWHYDTFRATWSEPTYAPSLVTFTLSAQGQASEITIAAAGAKLAARKSGPAKK